MKFVYVITKRGEKSFWTKIGAAFDNRDGSISVKLDALPVNGELQIREQKDRDGGAPRGDNGDDMSW